MRTTQDEEELEDGEVTDAEPEPSRPTEGDLVASVMQAVRNHSTMEKPTMSEPTSDPRCTAILNSGRPCGSWPKKGEDVCLRHYAKRTGKPVAKQAGLIPSVTTLPAKRPHAPIILAEPQIVNQPANGHNVALPAIHDLITQYEHDLATLRATKEILERLS